ncbi:MAG: N-acetyltransferase, partial [Sulfitobacter sp.]
MVGSEDIRLAVSADAEAITEMLAYLAEDMGDRAAFASTPEAIREFGFGPRPLFSVLIASGAGLCLFFPHFSTTRGCPGVYVQDLWVDPSARKQNLGTRLLTATAAQASKSWNAQYMALTTHGHNDAARIFYSRLGFISAEDDVPMKLTGQEFVL